MKGFEPPRRETHGPQPCASASSATSACYIYYSIILKNVNTGGKMNYIDRIAEYIKSGEIQENKFKVGAEYEHLVLDKDGKNISYSEKNGAKDIFKRLLDYGWEVASVEGENILSLSKGEYNITTEPGGQIEFSSDPKKSLDDLKNDIKYFYNEMNKALLDANLFCLGFQPVSKIEDIKILPKKRYFAMHDYFEDHGTMSHSMMKGTAALQCAIDYKSESDFSKKYTLATKLSNIFYALFDNTPFVNGKFSPINAYRAYIWENTDPNRSGVIKDAFKYNFSYSDYAKYISNIEAIFKLKKDEYIFSTEKIGKIIDDGVDEKELEHLLTMVFPDVRAKKFIEIRYLDAIPYPYNIAYLQLIKSIFYNDDNMDRLYNLIGDLTYNEHQKARKELYEKGIKAKMMGKTLVKWGMDMYDTLELTSDEKNGIKPILGFLEGNSLKRIMQEAWKTRGTLYDAISKCKIDLGE